MTKIQSTIYLMMFAVVSSLAQVGINTVNPQRTLDVNGSLRIRSISDVNTNGAYNRVLLMDGEGENTSGNVDYNSIDDFRLKMLDLSKLTQEQINEINKYLGRSVCVKGSIGDGGQPTDNISFPSGYEFRARDGGFGIGQVQIKKTGTSTNGKRQVIGGEMIGSGDISINSSWQTLVSSSFVASDSGKAVLIISGTAQTFEITLAQKNEGGNKVYSLCVAQTVK